MMYCTTLHLKKRTFYRWLFLVLFIGLLLQSITPLQDQVRLCFPGREAGVVFAVVTASSLSFSWHDGGGYCSVAWA